MDKPLTASMTCGCHVSEGFYDEVCKADAAKGRKVGEPWKLVQERRA